MSLTIRDTGSPPEEGFLFPVASTGHTVHAWNWASFYSQIEIHCANNNVQPPSLQEVVDYVCTNQNIACYDSETRQPFANAWLTGMPQKLPNRVCCGDKKT